METKPNESRDDYLTSGKNISFWISSIAPLKFTPVMASMDTDVVVVGGGIAGLTVAYCLLKSGKKVIVIEDGFIGSGETGRTTAHISNAFDDRYYNLEKYHGKEGARKAAESHTAAIAFIKKTVQEEGIDCDFMEIPGYLFIHPSDSVDSLQKEHTATVNAGIKTELLNNVPGIPYEKGPCLMFPSQGQFHPMKYLQGLCKAIQARGGLIYTESHAGKIDGNYIEVNDYKIKAADIVVATNTPINNLFTIHTKQFPYRTYVISQKIPKGKLPYALWWDTGDYHSEWITQPYHYVRLQPFDSNYDLLICGGEDHKTGQPEVEKKDADKRYKNLAEWVELRFPELANIQFRWSGQVMEPLDFLGFIGKNPGNDHIYIASGDSGNGITHGTIAGILINDLINGIDNPWAELYSPARITVKVTGDYLHEVGNMVSQYADYLHKSDINSTLELDFNKGAIMNHGTHKAAIYRDVSGQLHAFTAVCPHLGCLLKWNDDEKTFDCPCHGSRFSNLGVVINGPAIHDLKPIEIRDE